MSKLPIISGQEMVKALSRIGYAVDHQTGSHAILRHNFYPHKRLTVPMHPELAKGTLRAIMRQAGINHKELLRLLN